MGRDFKGFLFVPSLSALIFILSFTVMRPQEIPGELSVLGRSGPDSSPSQKQPSSTGTASIRSISEGHTIRSYVSSLSGFFCPSFLHSLNILLGVEKAKDIGGAADSFHKTKKS